MQEEFCGNFRLGNAPGAGDLTVETAGGSHGSVGSGQPPVTTCLGREPVFFHAFVTRRL